MSDSSEQLLLSADAEGRVNADFSGHVSAAGVELLAGEYESPPIDRKIRWLRSDGVLVAEIEAYDYSDIHAAALRASGTSDRFALAELRADQTSEDAPSARVRARAPSDTASPANVYAIAGGHFMKVIDSSGDSDVAYNDLSNAVIPRGRVRMSNNQGIASGGAGAKLNLDSVIYLGDGMTFSAADKSLVVPSAGLYELKGKLYAVGANGASNNLLDIEINGGNYDRVSHPDPAPYDRAYVLAATEVQLAAGDRVSLRYIHNKSSGVTLAGIVGGSGHRGNWLSVRKVAV